MNCVFIEDGPADENGRRSVRCKACGTVLVTAATPANIRCECSSNKARPGPGTELHKLIAALGITPHASCGCAAMQARMDAGGPDWCRAHREEILAHLRTAYKAADWGTCLQAGLRSLGHLGPFTLGGLLEEAIRRAARCEALASAGAGR